jgi:ubiquinol-cytochrome c reductase iron-sulfur subunit
MSPSPKKESAPKSVVVCFAVGAVLSAGFAVAYALDLGTPVLGATIGGGLAFIALGLAIWSQLIDDKEPEYVEERDVGPSPQEEFDTFHEALVSEPVPRSRVLWGMFGLSVGALGAAALFPIRSMFPSEGGNPDDLLTHTAFAHLRHRHLVTEEGVLIKPDDLEIGEVLTAFPSNYDSRVAEGSTLLIRVDPADLQLPAGRETWAVEGVVAYSKLCTHAGCPVGLYAQESNQLLCPCHHSIFDVLRGAPCIEGPAPHPLPQLPLGTDSDGYLIARGDFSGPVGAAWWGYPA